MYLFIVLASIFLLIFLCFLWKVQKNIILLVTFIFAWVALFFTLFFFNQKATEYLTEKGVLIIFAHLFVLCFGALFYNNRNLVTKRLVPKLRGNKKMLFILLLLISFTGIYLFSTQVNLLYAIKMNQVAGVRDKLFTKTLVVSPVTILLSNFLYPLAVVAPLYTLVGRRKIILLIVVIALFIVYSLSSGGKGGILLLMGVLLGSIIYLFKIGLIRLDKRLKLYFVLFISVIVGVIFYITSSRVVNTQSLSQDTGNMFVVYFTDSVPAFCALLEIKDYAPIDFDLAEHSLVRNVGAVLGKSTQRQIDTNIVYVPEAFNVFTSLADSIYSLGLYGSLLYYFLLGICFSFVDNLRKLEGVFLYGVFFLFSFYSIYVDIFYFVTGSWYCVLFYFIFKFSNKESKQDKLFSV